MLEYFVSPLVLIYQFIRESVEGWIKQLKESGKDDEGLLLIAPSGIYATVNDLLTQIESKYNENERIKAIREDFVLLKKTSTLLKTEVVPLYKAISAVSINQADLVRVSSLYSTLPMVTNGEIDCQAR
jgi:hypothetical protein